MLGASDANANSGVSYIIFGQNVSAVTPTPITAVPAPVMASSPIVHTSSGDRLSSSLWSLPTKLFSSVGSTLHTLATPTTRSNGYGFWKRSQAEDRSAMTPQQPTVESQLRY